MPDDLTAADAARLLAESTPGPWTVDPTCPSEITSDAAYPGDPSDDGAGWTVAYSCGHPRWEYADARLIAAGPDLALAVVRLDAEIERLRLANGFDESRDLERTLRDVLARWVADSETKRAEIDRLRAHTADLEQHVGSIHKATARGVEIERARCLGWIRATAAAWVDDDDTAIRDALAELLDCIESGDPLNTP